MIIRGRSSATLVVPFLLYASIANAANLYDAAVTPLKAPDCITDLSASFVQENTQPTQPPHPTLPLTHDYLIVRYVGDSAIGSAPAYDFGHIRGLPLTGLTVPDPKSAWQRSSRPDADPDVSSAFQLHCEDAGSFINTWTFPDQTITGGGPHSIYGYSFNDPAPPLAFDGSEDTDFVLQASVEVPWFAAWSTPIDGVSAQPTGQVNLFVYFRDRATGKTFALLLGLFDNRAVTGASYPSAISHDTVTPFVSVPLVPGSPYATVSPYSATYTGTPWSGLRFFRAHVTPANFRAALADINAFCRDRADARLCGFVPSLGGAFSPSITDYEITDIGAIHEVGRGGAGGNLSMGAHIRSLGAFNFRPRVATPGTLPVIEFYNAELDHWFITGDAGEIRDLDTGVHPGWSRTGQSFLAYPPGHSALPAVSRFYGRPELGLNSHFFTADAAELSVLLSGRLASAWGLETRDAFEVATPDAGTGACPAGTLPVYRLWNGRTDSNHRYTTDRAIRQRMLDRGYVAEGAGRDGVVMCAAQ
jgi:hypothetical protein